MSTSTSGLQTVEQRRAQHAWKAITALGRNGTAGGRAYGEDAQEYAREAKKLPVRIRAAGLGQALAFLLARARDKKPRLSQLHDDLTEWVLIKRPLGGKDPGSLLQSILQGNSDFLRRATDETLAYLIWLNRFAEAEGLTGGEEKA